MSLDDSPKLTGSKWISTDPNWITAICSVLGLCLLYTQTPLFEGTRPKLTYWTESSNTNTKDADGHYHSSVKIMIENKSRFPAKDVYVVICPLDCAEVNVETAYHVETVRGADASGQNFLLLKTIPANTTVQLDCTTQVTAFPDKEDFDWVGRNNPFDEDEAVKTIGKSLHYFSCITNVYTEFGEVPELKHLSHEVINYAPEDYRSEESKTLQAAFREKQREERRKAGKIGAAL